MKLSSLLKLQFLYIAIAIGYNIVSLLINLNTGRPLTATIPKFSTILVLIFIGLFYFTAFLKNKIVYRTLMGISGILIFYNGVVPHAINITNISTYYNFLAWVLAIGINLYGTILFAISALGKFNI